MEVSQIAKMIVFPIPSYGRALQYRSDYHNEGMQDSIASK
jgi:hypothetical protein